jgi:hypothetical protein
MRGLWLRWLPTFVAFIAGGELAIVVVERVDSLAAALVGGALAGAVIGAGQWLALRGYLPRAGWWVAASAAGQAVGLAAGAALVGYGTSPGELAAQGAVTGLAIGGLQAIVLGRHGAGWRWWALAAPPLWALGWVVTWAAGIDVEAQYANFGASGAIVVTALSGLLLARLLRGASTSEARLPLAAGEPA